MFYAEMLLAPCSVRSVSETHIASWSPFVHLCVPCTTGRWAKWSGSLNEDEWRLWHI